MKPVTVSIVKQALAPRPDDAHKGTMGTLLSICGCYGMAGACLLSSKAALRSGVGLLKCALPKSIYPIAAAGIWESVYLPLEETPDGKTAAANLPFLRDQAADAVLMGCGMSVCDDTRTLVRGFLEACDKPLLLDADALNCLADDPSVLRRVKAPVVITPHPAEMGRLLGVSAGEVNADREMTAKRFAADYGVIVVLKGAGTVTAAPDGRAVINTTGNSGMATGGSGDVLAGICASLLAQGGEAFDSAAAAVYLHGLAGDLAAARLGKISMLPTDLLDALPQAFLSVQRSGKER